MEVSERRKSHHFQMHWFSNLQSDWRDDTTCQAQNGNQMIADVGRTATARATSVK